MNALAVIWGANDRARQRLVQSYVRQGFALKKERRWTSESRHREVLIWSHPLQDGQPDSLIEDDRGLACCVGTLWYRQSFGRAALGLLLDEIRLAGKFDERALRGSFVALLALNDGPTWLFNDPMGFARIYRTEDSLCYSTSWLAARAWIGSADIDEAAAVEYVLVEAPHSSNTAAKGVSRLPLGKMVDLALNRIVRRFDHSFWSEAPRFRTMNDAVDRLSSHLRVVFEEAARAFPDRINAALSGGFDSRLIVAGLRSQGQSPRLFVYGDPGSKDVVVARAVAQGEGLPLRVVDKRSLTRDLPSPNLEELVASALFFDGLPNDGIDDAGIDRQTRIAQTADGSLALNGGGGEIFRNFFHLPDRSMTATDLVRTFYRTFDAAVFRSRTGLMDYTKRLGDSIAQTLGGSERLDREQVELAYPLFRCHFWMSTNNSIEVRHGYFSTPLIDAETVRASWRIPLAWKNAGLLESRLIEALHRGVAAHRSMYGFSFDEGPGLRARLSEWFTCQRPVRVRPCINAARRRLQRIRPTPDLLARYRAMLPGEWFLDSVLDLTRLPDDASLARAMSVELVTRELKP